MVRGARRIRSLGPSRRPSAHGPVVDRRSAHRHRRPHRDVGALRCARRLPPRALVGAELHGDVVTLSWNTGEGATASAELHLPDAASWRLVRGGTDPVLGWYSARFGEKQPTTTIIGEGACHGRDELETALEFHS